MPNHVTINLVVTGDKESLAEFANSHIIDIENESAGVGQFSFDTIIPMPIALRNTCSPTKEPDPVLIEKYGTDNWYDWALTNWNTKWGAYDLHINAITKDVVDIHFQTAWSLPEPIFVELMELYPTLRFEVTCCEEGGFFAGEQIYENGNVQDNLVEGKEWHKWAVDFYGGELDENGEIVY